MVPSLGNLDAYISAVNKLPLLTPEEEQEYARTLRDLRLPMAMPFLFSALKVNATLALIGAIVAEFFGSPTSGLGFRISTEATRMNMGLVWAAVAVAAVTGSAVYAMLVSIEKRAAFWHPSVRGKK
jgi:NitT/TauT family transport system permease protein